MLVPVWAGRRSGARQICILLTLLQSICTGKCSSLLHKRTKYLADIKVSIRHENWRANVAFLHWFFVMPWSPLSGCSLVLCWWHWGPLFPTLGCHNMSAAWDTEGLFGMSLIYRIIETLRLAKTLSSSSADVSTTPPCSPLIHVPSCSIHTHLNSSRNGDFTAALGSLFQCLTALAVKQFFLIFHLNFPWCNPRTFAFVLSLVLCQKSLSPTSLQPLFRELQRVRSSWASFSPG